MSIASRITEMETHIGNAYTSIDNLGIDISNTNKNIYNISALLDTFYERLPKVSGIGASLSLSPSMVGKIKLNEIQGDTLQNGTPTPSSPVPIQSVTGLQNVEVCGKNIFNGEIRQGNQNYTTTSARLFSNKNDWYFTSGTKLTFSTDLPNTFKVCFYLAKKPYLSEQYTAMQSFSYFSNGEQSITLTADGYLGFTIAKNDETAIIPSDVANYHFQIEYGETKSSYKQYNGNTYEVNLGNIELNKTGDYEDSIKKSTGKNLFNATLDRYATNRVRTNVYSVLPNTTYTISVGTSRISVVNYYKDINQSDISDSGLKSMPYTFTTPSNCYYIQQIIRKSDDSNITLDELSTIMLNKGSTTLPYEPYGKVWYIEKQYLRKVLNGTENVGTRSNTSTTHSKFVLANILDYEILNNVALISSRFETNSGANTQAYSENAICSNSTSGYKKYLYFSIQNDLANTIEEFKTWLSNNNVEVLYQLATPIYEVITNTELINQLESLYNAKSKDGTTNINVTSEDLSMILNVGVLKGE